MTLLEECIEALKGNIKILTKEEQTKVFNNFTHNLPITLWARIDWDKIKHHKIIYHEKDILQYVNLDDLCFIIWDDMPLPLLKHPSENF